MRALLLLAVAACTPSPTQPTSASSADASVEAAHEDPQPSKAEAKAEPPPSLACTRDDECAISNVRGCCSPCASPPFADLKRNVDALRGRCAAVRCAQGEPQECKPTEDPSAYHAVCQSSSCAMVRNAPVPPQQLTSTERCAKDDECAVTNFSSCCSPCQSSAYATSKKELDARNRRCAVVDCAVGTNVACEPIVDASLYRAVCRAGTCGGIKR